MGGYGVGLRGAEGCSGRPGKQSITLFGARTFPDDIHVLRVASLVRADQSDLAPLRLPRPAAVSAAAALALGHLDGLPRSAPVFAVVLLRLFLSARRTWNSGGNP